MFFMPVIYGYDPASRMQAVSFLSDGGVMLAIWWLESLRCRPMPWFLHNPSILTLASQLVGLGVVCPLYCFLSYIYAPIDSPVSSDQRSSLTAVLPALLVGYYIPAYAMFFWPDLAERQSWLFLWQLYPVLISIAYHAVTLGTATPRNRSVVAKLSRDLLAVRVCIGVSVVLGASVWLWTRFSAPLSMATIFAPTGVPRLSLPSLTAFSGQFLRWDEVFVFGPMLLWLAYLYEDTKRAGLLQASWLSLIPLAAAAVIALGPGAAVGLGWLWREEAILARHEKDTLMLEVAAKVDALLKANGA
ncbi:hypothetical protein B0H67DRAFT_494899 [Lasiosphaeris hirsuta]|uniref:Uncharacterized protein n=1 Tax=Lasiosphaeris hirsuta TaxID=260670 RepID=A0AA40DQ87_9PEZI|nr:hypothetical protein B0H67DRAFT_494899 [Lasiosphaeris hirsuta]